MSRMFVASGVLLVATALVTTPVHADECRVGCNMQKKACVQAARVEKLSCKAVCRDSAAPEELGSCMRVCTDTFRATKDGCRADHTTCREGCATGVPGGDDCLDDCGAALAACANDVVTDGKACVQACDDPATRLACLADCAAAAESGAMACGSAFESCTASCGGGGSPSPAFLGNP